MQTDNTAADLTGKCKISNKFEVHFLFGEWKYILFRDLALKSLFRISHIQV